MTKTSSMAVAAGELRPALAALGKVRLKGKAVPDELQHLKVETVGRSSLRLTVTDREFFFSLTLSTTKPIEKTGPFLVPIEPLQRAIRGARVSDIIPIQVGPGIPASKFPASPVIRGRPVPLASPVVTAFQHALGCSSKDPTRYVLQGIHLDPEAQGGTRIIATDGRHLFQSHPYQIRGLKGGFILPAHPVLSSPVVSGERSWELRIPGKANGASPCFQLKGKNWSLTGKLIEGNYPKYQQVIPPEGNFKTMIHFPSDLGSELLRAIPRLPGKKLSNKPIALQTNEGSICVLARQNESKPCEELVLPSAETKGKNQTVFLNRDYLAQSLRCGMTQIEIIDENSPVKCTGKSGILIIMPVRSFGEVKIGHSQTLGTREAQRKKENPSVKIEQGRKSPETKPESLTKKIRKPTRQTMKTSSSTGNQTQTADEKIAEIKSALKAAASGLSELTATLRASRQQRRKTEKEVKSVRQTLRRLRKVEL